jgi:hypothetical protein
MHWLAVLMPGSSAARIWAAGRGEGADIPQAESEVVAAATNSQAIWESRDLLGKPQSPKAASGDPLVFERKLQMIVTGLDFRS